MRQSMKPFKFLLFLLLTNLFSCKKQSDLHYKKLSPDETGISFVNTIQENQSVNMIDYAYLYNGGGVGAGDLNGDGLPDLYFTGNQTTGKLYLNKGNLKFEDITKPSNVISDNWATGVTFADVNADGLLDIYVCRSGNVPPEQRRNLLFINRGNNKEQIPVFEEKAVEYGIADQGYSTQAAFFDYDKDGDLDLYVMNVSNSDRNPNRIKAIQKDGNSEANDHLYRNDTKDGKISFKDVSKEAHILDDGWGLGLAINDVNNDGWEDIFVSNDFLANDLLYLNNHDGTFTEKTGSAFGHTSQFSMGNDIADFNNDGWMDIVTADMLPREDEKRKKMAGTWTYESFEMAMKTGFTPEYMRNTLQLNNGLNAKGEICFSEIGQFAGIYATDWSWSPILSDLDNDGWKDLFISNGYRRDITDLDFISYNAENQFNDNKIKELAKKQPDYKTVNRLFINNKNLGFEEKTKEWGIEDESFSNGAVTVDLDNDGDLDIVCNNIDEPAGIYENKIPASPERNYLHLKLVGDKLNTFAIGAKVEVFSGKDVQTYHHTVTRGFQSSMDYRIHFGVGRNTKLDSLRITWTDGSGEVFRNIAVNQTLTIRKKSGFILQQFPENQLPENNLNLYEIQNEEIVYNDFSREPFLLHKYSNESHKITKGDINGDGLEDFFAGGGPNESGRFFIQQKDGSFEQKKLEKAPALNVDAGVLLFDADQDHDLDLYIVSGGNQYEVNSPDYQDRLYLNDGKGNFLLSADAIPKEQSPGSCVRACDFDKDGDLDLFIGGRRSVEKYPLAGRSFLLENKNGRFSDITPEALKQVGLVTDAVWTDFDGDHQNDLIVVGEFMNPVAFKNSRGKLSEKVLLTETKGFWNCIQGADFDGDGDIDYIIGNYGLNNRFGISTETPLRVYDGDFDGNGRNEPLTTYYINGKERLAHSRDDLTKQLNGFRKFYPDYASFAKAETKEILEKAKYRVSEINNSASCYFENKGKGEFEMKVLPSMAQLAPVKAILIDDFNHDGKTDLFLAGNQFGIETSLGRQDASMGLILLGDGKGSFKVVNPVNTLTKFSGEIYDLGKIINAKGKAVYLVSK